MNTKMHRQTEIEDVLFWQDIKEGRTFRLVNGDAVYLRSKNNQDTPVHIDLDSGEQYTVEDCPVVEVVPVSVTNGVVVYKDGTLDPKGEEA